MLVGAAEESNQENLGKTDEAVGNVSTKYSETSTAANNASTAIADAESANQTNIKKTGDAAGIAKKRIADMARGEHRLRSMQIQNPLLWLPIRLSKISRLNLLPLLLLTALK